MTTLNTTAPAARARPSWSAQDLGGHDDGEHVDGRAGVEECGGRTEPRTHPVDAREQRQHRARAHGENRSRDRSDTVREWLGCSGPQIAHHGRLGDERCDRACDPERGQQAQHDVLSCVPLRQFECFAHCAVEPRLPTGRKVDGREDSGQETEDLQLMSCAGSRVRVVMAFSVGPPQAQSHATRLGGVRRAPSRHSMKCGTQSSSRR